MDNANWYLSSRNGEVFGTMEHEDYHRIIWNDSIQDVLIVVDHSLRTQTKVYIAICDCLNTYLAASPPIFLHDHHASYNLAS
jgi:hypothetical protein